MYKRRKILSFVKKDFPQYTWSVRTLDRRLRYFEIYYSDKDVDIDQVKEAVVGELEGPGKLLGYRAMQKKIRQVHHLDVPRDLVHAVVYDLDPERLENRCVCLPRKGNQKVVSPPKGQILCFLWMAVTNSWVTKTAPTLWQSMGALTPPVESCSGSEFGSVTQTLC